MKVLRILLLLTLIFSLSCNLKIKDAVPNSNPAACYLYLEGSKDAFDYNRCIDIWVKIDFPDDKWHSINLKEIEESINISRPHGMGIVSLSGNHKTKEVKVKNSFVFSFKKCISDFIGIDEFSPYPENSIYYGELPFNEDLDLAEMRLKLFASCRFKVEGIEYDLKTPPFYIKIPDKAVSKYNSYKEFLDKK